MKFIILQFSPLSVFPHFTSKFSDVPYKLPNYGTVDRGFNSWQGPPRPDRFWGLFSLLSNGYGGLLSRVQSDRGVKLTTHLNLVSRLRMRGVLPQIPQYVSVAWCLVKQRENLNFTTCQYWKSLDAM